MSRPTRPQAARLPMTPREAYAAALESAEVEYRTAQAALALDDSNQARGRYARALYDYDRLSAMFPFVAAGAADVKA